MLGSSAANPIADSTSTEINPSVPRAFPEELIHMERQRSARFDSGDAIS